VKSDRFVWFNCKGKISSTLKYKARLEATYRNKLTNLLHFRLIITTVKCFIVQETLGDNVTYLLIFVVDAFD